MKSLVLVLALCAAALSASAQSTVYRCGADGRSYSDGPCKDGRSVEVSDPRSAEQARAATDAARREREMADALSSERHARESAGAQIGVAALGTTGMAAASPAAKAKKLAAPSRQRPRKPVSQGSKKSSRTPAKAAATATAMPTSA